MFEGWASDLLASYLGHFLDVKKEQLRISLWSAWSTGLVLENVKLKPEAFEHLQLAFAIQEGSLGRLEIQVPWRALRSRPVIVEASAVRLVACARLDSDWEEGPAVARAQAAKEARLAAAELERLSKPAAHEREQRGLGWSFLSHLGTMLLNRLQLSVRDVHLSFRDEDAGGDLQRVFGLQLQSLHNLALVSLAADTLGEAPAAPPAAQLTKRIEVEGVCVYWRCRRPSAKPGTDIGTSMSNREGSALGASMEEGIEPADYVLQPLSCQLLLSMTTGHNTSEFSITARVTSLNAQLHQQQVRDILAFSDRAGGWEACALYAELRPDGWSTREHQPVPWRRVWQYAISAVLLDKRRTTGWQVPSLNHSGQKRRRQYVRLYQQRLSTLRSGRILAEVKDADELRQLESELDLGDILLFRSLAERALEQAHHEPAEEAVDPDAASNRRAPGWLPWGLSGLSGYLGAAQVPQRVAQPSESDIQELYKELNFDPESHAKGATSSMRISLHLNVEHWATNFAGVGQNSTNFAIASIECEGLSIEFDQPGSLPRLKGTLQELSVFDECSQGLGGREVIVSQWDQGLSDGKNPIVAFQLGNSEADSDAVTEARSPAELEVAVEPLQVLYRPTCFAALAALVEYSDPDSLGAQLMASANQLPTASSRALAKAERAMSLATGPGAKMKVKDLLIRFEASSTDADNITIQTGEINVQSSQRGQLLPEQATKMLQVIREGQQDAERRTSLAFADALRKVERRLLYDRWEVSLETVQLSAASSAMTSPEMSPILAPLRLSASLNTCKLHDPMLPSTRARLLLGMVDVALDPCKIAALWAVTSARASAASAIIAGPEGSNGGHTAAEEPKRAVLAELDVSAPTVRLRYDDSQEIGDASETHFELETQILEVSVGTSSRGISCKAIVKAVQLADTSNYTLSPPPLKGLIPRLAREIIVDTLSLRFEGSDACGLMLSGELLGALALGFQGEIGNFILRAKPNVPTIGRFTHRRTPTFVETNITLQDGCFGVATLMRIAALFIPSDKPEQNVDGSTPQSTPALPEQPDARASTSRAIRDTTEAGLEASTGAAAQESVQAVLTSADAEASDGVANCVGTPTKAGEVASVEQVGAAAAEEDTGGQSSSPAEESDGVQQNIGVSAINGEEDTLRGSASTTDGCSGCSTYDPQETPGTSETPFPDRAAQSLLDSEEVPPPCSTSPSGSHTLLSEVPDLPPEIIPAPSSAAPTESETFRERSEANQNSGLASVADDTQQAEGRSDTEAKSLTADLAGATNYAAGASEAAIPSPDGISETQNSTYEANKQIANRAATNEAEADMISEGASTAARDTLTGMSDLEAEPIAKADRFSIEILRCRAVSPEWQDFDWGEGTPHVSAHGKPDMVVLSVPHFLLQLPAHDPAQHPKLHPVQEATAATASTNFVTDKAPASSSPTLQPSPFAAAQSPQQLQKRVIISGSHLTLQVAVFDRGKPHALQLSSVHPFLTIPRIDASTTLPSQPQQLTPSKRPSTKGDLTKDSFSKRLQHDRRRAEISQHQEFIVNLPSIGLSSTPRQLATLRSVIAWGTGEMNHILGREPMAPLEPEGSRRQSLGESPARVAGRGTPGMTPSAPRRSPHNVAESQERRARWVDVTGSSPDRVAPGSDRLAAVPMTDDSALLSVAQLIPGSTPDRDNPLQRKEFSRPGTISCETAAAADRESGKGHDGSAEEAESDAIPDGPKDTNPTERKSVQQGPEGREVKKSEKGNRPWRLLGDLSTVALHLQASDGSVATLAFFCSGICCDVGRNADGIAHGRVSLGSAVVRLLDPAESSSDSENGQAVEGNITARVAARLAKPQRTTTNWGRLKRAASAPVPPLLGLMSRAGSSTSLGSNQAQGPPLDLGHPEGPLGGSQSSLTRSESLQIASPGLAEVVKGGASLPHAIVTSRWGSKAAAWGASASLSLLPENSLPLSRQGSTGSSHRWQPMPSIRSLGSPSQTPSMHSEASSAFHSASSKNSDLLTLGSGALSQAGVSDFYDPTEADSGSPLSSSQLETATEGSIFDPQAAEEHPGVDLLLLRGREGPAKLTGDSWADDSAADSSSIALRLRDGEDGALDIALGGVLLRVNLQGSEVAVERLQECARALVEEVRDVAKEAPLIIVSEATNLVPTQLLHVKTGQLVAEAIVTSLNDGDVVAPCISVHFTMAADIAIARGQSRLQRFSMPQLEVLCSLIDPEQDIQNMEKSASAGTLLAWRNLSFLPASSGRTNSATVPAAVQTQISLDRLSVWASSHRLSILAALFANLADLRRLIDHRSQREEVLKLPQVQDIALDRRLDGCHLSLRCLAVVLSSDSPRDSIPLLEVALLDASGSARRAESLLLGHLEARVLANVYSSMRMGWEPVIEPWPFALQLERNSSPSEAAQPALGSGQTSLSVTSKQVLELTATLATFKAARAAQQLLQRVQGVAADPPSVEASLLAANQDAALLGISTYVVQNATGTAIQYWLGGESRFDASPRRRLDKRTLGRDMSAELPIHVQSPSSRLSKYAGQPGTFFQDSEERALDSTPSVTLSARSSNISNGHLAVARVAYKQLFFRLDSQEDQCGPLALERDLEGTCAVTVHTHRATGIPSLASVSYNIAHDRNGGCTVSLHSGVKVTNMASMPLTVGLENAMVMGPSVLGVLLPGSFLWLPVLRAEPGMLCIQPAEENDTPSFKWSAGVRLQPLLDLSRTNGQRIARQVVCKPVNGADAAVKFNLGVIPSTDFAGWNIVVRAPLVLQNCLPMPVHITLKARGAAAATRVTMEPRRQESLHSVDANQLDEIVMRPLGYQWSAPMSVPKLEDVPDSRPVSTLDQMSAPGVEEYVPVREGHGSFKVTEAGEGRGTATVRLKHILEEECGSHVLRLSCTLWVYNCTGLPIALQQSDVEEQRSLLSELIDDDVPKQWLPPYEGLSAPPQPSRPPSTGISRTSSRSSTQGLSQALATSRLSIETRVHTEHLQRTGGPAPRGMAESIATVPSYNTPSSWPSMQGGFPLQRRKLDLQLRASQIRAPPGRTLWSSPVHLDALGGAAVVSVPCPMSGTASAVLDHRAAYVLAVTATQVAGGDGALAVHVMPRYVLHNSLDIPMHYKQQNTNAERELRANGARALHWADAGRPLRLCLRVQEAGWLWSGGIALDTPGDLFVKIRHKDRGVTMLLRVDVSTSASGALLVTLSNQAAGFAPYRLDNCTSYTLHLSQQSYNEQEDVLRPYSSLLYAWDEPALPHKLVLALPGNRRLGAFNLDKVGETATLALRGQSDTVRRMQVLVRAEGPTRVLSITDLQMHLPIPLLSAVKGESLGWEPWSGSLNLTQAAMGQVAIPPPGLELEARLELAGIGISLVATSQEILYARASGIDVRSTSSKIRHTLEAAVRNLQVDNPNQSAAYPVMLASPVVPQRLGIGIVADTLPVGGAPLRTAAFCMRAAVWRRRPAGVVCVERMEMRLAPLALEAEQQHMTGILGAASAALEPFSATHRPARRLDEPDLDILRGGYSSRHLQEMKVYIEHLLIGSIVVTVSFLPADWNDLPRAARRAGARLSPGLLRLLSLVGEVEGGCIRLAQLELHHPLLGTTALQQQAYSHYMRAAMPELVKLVGSANLLGDPASLFHHLGLGIWSLLAIPTAGLVESARGQGPQRIAVGFAGGFQSMLSNTIFAFSNATVKASNAARKVLVVLGVEHSDASGVPLRQRRSIQGRESQPARSIIAVLLDGIVGIVSEPVRGADEGGVAGFLTGTYRGLMGALVRPVASLLETSAKVADSIRNVVMGPPATVPRVRPPRYVSAVDPLARYDWSEAIGRYLVAEVEGGSFSSEEFLLCRQLSNEVEFAVLTQRRLLLVSWPGLRFLPSVVWAVDVDDVLDVGRQDSSVRVLSLQPSVVHKHSVNPLRKHALVAPGRLPYFSAVLSAKDGRDARVLSQAVKDARDASLACCSGFLLTSGRASLGCADDSYSQDAPRDGGVNARLAQNILANLPTIN